MNDKGKKVLLLVGLGVGVSASAALLYYLMRRYEEEVLQDTRGGISTSQMTSVSVQVPRDMVGSIIGREGANIKDLQDKTNTRIRFDDAGSAVEGSEFRTVLIRGSSSNVQEAQSLIHGLIHDQAKILTEEIFIPVRVCGRIIGKNGETIRTMCHQSQAKILVDRGGAERDPDDLKRVTIRGSRQQIEAAISLIDEKLAEEEAFRQKVALSAAGRAGKYSRAQKMITVGDDQQGNRTTKTLVRESLLVNANDSYSDVFVSSVVDPGQFWVQLVGTKSVELDKMVEEMTDFYEVEANQNLQRVSTVAVGDVVAAPFMQDESWYRASVRSVLTDDYSPAEAQVTVYYEDFGDTLLLKQSQLCQLDTRWRQMPFQAIECRLANVKGTLPGGAWSQQATEAFKEMTYAAQWQVVLARPLKNPTSEDSAYLVEIYDTKGKRDVNVGLELIEKHLAHADSNLDESSRNGNC